MPKPIQPEGIRAMMFDLDGTLIDSIPAYFELMASVLEVVGIPPAPLHLTAEFLTDGITVLEKIIPEEMAGQKEELTQAFISVGAELSKGLFEDTVQVIKGVPELFSLLCRRNILIAVVTATHRRAIHRKLRPLVRGNIRDALREVVVIEDAPKQKPAPDPLLECARRLEVAVEHCVYVGDSHVDIRAGNAAGMMTIGVLTGLDDYDTLKKEDPAMILKSVDEIRGVLEGCP